MFQKKRLLLFLTFLSILFLAIFSGFVLKAFSAKKAIPSKKEQANLSTLKSDSDNITYSVTQYGKKDSYQSMFYTIKSSDGQLIIIDGGYDTDADSVRKIILDHGGIVDAWILTHPHPDHIGAFSSIFENLEGITIRHIYTIKMDYDKYKKLARDWDQFDVFEKFHSLTEHSKKLTYLHQGDTLSICGLTMEVFSAYDEYVANCSKDLCNDGSLLFQLSGKQDKMLFCADVGKKLSESLIKTYGNKLKSDYIQMGHHGNGGLSEDFYRLVNPKVAFFDAPDWLMDNKNQGTDIPANYTTPKNREIMESMRAKIYSFHTAPNTVTLQ